MNQPVSDPFDSAENPQLRQAEFWGQVQMDMWFGTFVPNPDKPGKKMLIPWDAQQHSLDKRVTSIEIKIIPLPECNIVYTVSRSMLAESKEWAGMVLPSIRTLGITTLRELSGKFVHVRYKPTGQTYVNAQGETKDQTTLEFIRLFGSEAECRADYGAAGAAAPAEDPNGHGPAAATPSNGNGAHADPEKATAQKFLKVVVENAVRGQTNLQVIRDTIAANLAGMPVINKHFTVDSPETMQMIVEAMQHA